MEVKAIIKKDDSLFKEIALENVSRNIFQGKLDIKEPGHYELTVYAYNSTTGNTGVDKVNYIVTE